MNAPEIGQPKSIARSSRRPTMAWAMLAVFVWCSVIAVGPLFYSRQYGLTKAAIIFGCMLLFMSLWGLALWGRKRRIEKAEADKLFDAER